MPFIDKVDDFVRKGIKIPETQIPSFDRSIDDTVKRAVEFASKVQNLDSPAAPDHLAVTDLSLYDQCPRLYYLLKVLNLPDVDFEKLNYASSDKGISAAETGEITHQILDRIDYNAPAKREVEYLIAPYKLGDNDSGKISGLLTNFLNSSFGEEIKNSSVVMREIPFTLFISDIPIHGRVDLLYRTANGAMRLIDFKTNNVKADEVEAKREEYRLQMELYGLALSRLDGMDICEGFAFFMKPCRAVKYDFTPIVLRKCSEKTDIIVESIKKGDFRPRNIELCKKCEYYNLYCHHFPGSEH